MVECVRSSNSRNIAVTRSFPYWGSWSWTPHHCIREQTLRLACTAANDTELSFWLAPKAVLSCIAAIVTTESVVVGPGAPLRRENG
jgi:hypothetical protein